LREELDDKKSELAAANRKLSSLPTTTSSPKSTGTQQKVSHQPKAPTSSSGSSSNTTNLRASSPSRAPTNTGNESSMSLYEEMLLEEVLRMSKINTGGNQDDYDEHIDHDVNAYPTPTVTKPSTSSGTGGGNRVEVKIRNRAEPLIIEIENTKTIKNLKEQIAQTENVAVAKVSLFANGVPVPDGDVLTKYPSNKFQGMIRS
jgi:hypothetical protein